MKTEGSTFGGSMTTEQLESFSKLQLESDVRANAAPKPLTIAMGPVFKGVLLANLTTAAIFWALYFIVTH